ncbi:hypothetical protein D0Z70_20010 [Sphingobium terrigena]|uniref:Uncharacterized protein n=2 Tax=Sphingobium terrigena TaxID=2304063 RepID=A0A418YMV8_9SPHN|nr:hypothetical protein D0Z70_20010 [Sphingobium terrigena]
MRSVGLVLSVGGALAGAWLLTVYIWPLYYLQTPEARDLKARLVRADRDHLSPMIFDRDHGFVSVLDYYDFEKGDGLHGNELSFGRHYSEDGHEDKSHVVGSFRPTVFVDKPNPDYVRCLRWLEDRTDATRGLLNPYGVDVRYPLSLIRSAVTFRAPRGGSTLIAQYQQNIGYEKQPSDGVSGKLRTIGRKANELFLRTPVMSQIVGEDPDNSARYAARAFSHLQGNGKAGDLRGLALSARLVFGVDQRALTTAQAIFLANAIQNPPKFQYGVNDSGVPIERGGYRKKWVYHKRRAMGCIREMAVPGQEAGLERAFDDIINAEQLTPRAAPAIEVAGKEGRSADDETGARWYVQAQDPLNHAAPLVKDVVNGAAVELRQAFGNQWNAAVSSVELAVSVPEQHRFRAAFNGEMRNWLHRADLRGELNPHYRSYAETGEGPSPDIALAVADAEGRIVRFYSTRDRSTYFGKIPLDRAGSYRWDQEQIQLASIGKIGAALLFARLGIDPARVVGAMAKSDTKEVEHQLEMALSASRMAARRSGRVPPDVVPDLLRQLRWSNRSSYSRSGGMESPARAFSRGTVAASPRTVHHDVSALLAAFMGQSGPVRAPTLLNRITYLEYAGGGPGGRYGPTLARLPDYQAVNYGAANFRPDRDVLAPLRGEALLAGRAEPLIRKALGSSSSTILPDRLLPRRDRQAVYQLLRAPFCAPNGTLSTLRDWCDRSIVLFGKTGTHDITDDYYKRRLNLRRFRKTGVVNALWIAGGIQLRDRRAYSFVLMVAGADTAHPLTIPRDAKGKDVEGGRLAPLLGMILRNLEGTGAPVAAREGN